MDERLPCRTAAEANERYNEICDARENEALVKIDERIELAITDKTRPKCAISLDGLYVTENLICLLKGLGYVVTTASDGDGCQSMQSWILTWPLVPGVFSKTVKRPQLHVVPPLPPIEKPVRKTYEGEACYEPEDVS